MIDFFRHVSPVARAEAMIRRGALMAVSLMGLSLLASGCKKDEPSGGASAAAEHKAAGPRVQDPHFSIELGPDGMCTVGEACIAKVSLTALAGYHVNKEYPYKFTAQATKDVEFLGKDPAGTSVFTKSAGDYTAVGEEGAVMTVRFRPKQAGKASVEGTYKFSVCSAQNCQIETAELAAKIDVK